MFEGLRAVEADTAFRLVQEAEVSWGTEAEYCRCDSMKSDMEQGDTGDGSIVVTLEDGSSGDADAMQGDEGPVDDEEDRRCSVLVVAGAAKAEGRA